MKSLLKVVKSSETVLAKTVVPIENTVTIVAPPPPPEPPPGEAIETEEAPPAINPEELERTLREEHVRLMAEARKQIEDAAAKAEADAKALLDDASARAEALLADAAKQAETLRERARSEGFAQGHKEGVEKAAEQSEKYLKAAAGLLSDINGKKDALFKRYEDSILETVLDISDKVIHANMDKDSSLLRGLLTQAAKRFRNADSLRITLSGLDVSTEAVTDLGFLREVLGDSVHIDIEVLASAESGTCVLDDGATILDASVHTQLEMIREIAKSAGRQNGGGDNN